MASSSSNKALKPVVSVCVTGAAGQIGYSIIFGIASGRMLGDDQPIDLRLLDITPCMEIVKGVIMELEDCAFPLLANVVGTDDPEVAFKDVDLSLLIGGRPRGPGMDRKDLLTANAAIFSKQGAVLNKVAKRSVKVLVVANPANTNALIAQQNAPDLPKTAFSAMTRLDQNRATALLAKTTKTNISGWKNVVVWGNHSNTQYPSVNHASYIAPDGTKQAARDVVKNNEFLDGEFIKTVQVRGAKIIEQMKKSSAASAANAAMDHMRDWVRGTAPGEFVSMAVYSDGSYGVPEGLMFSFPCECKDGQYKIVQGLPLNNFDKEKLKLTAEELQQEKTDALSLPAQ